MDQRYYPQPRGRPRYGCTWDTITGQWLPTHGFTGIAPQPKTKYMPRKERFKVIIARPPIPKYTTEQMEIQRRLWHQNKMNEAENMAQFERESKEFIDKEKERQIAEASEVAAKASAEAVRANAEYNLSKNRMKRHFPRQPSYPVYYMDEDDTLHELYPTSSVAEDTRACKQQRNEPHVYDELRDSVWPKLFQLNVQRKAIETRIILLNDQLTTGSERMKASVKPKLEVAKSDRASIYKQISVLGEKQKRLLQKSWGAE